MTMVPSREPRSNRSLTDPHLAVRNGEVTDPPVPTDAATLCLADEPGPRDPHDALILMSARLYAKRPGWRVVPLYGVADGRCECGNDECERIGKHPRTRRGVKQASRDAGQLVKWWSAHPNSNLGIATGKGSNIFVLDVDCDRDGDRSLIELERRHGPLPRTVRAVTGKGEHFYFQYPGRSVRCSSDKIARGLDIRGDGGLIVAPPSLHASGRRYTWKEGYGPQDIDVAPAPDWLLDQLGAARSRSRREETRARPGAPVGFAYAFVLDGVPKGRRNWSIFRMSASLRGLGTPPAVIESLALHAAKNCKPPLGATETLAAARSAMRYPPNAEQGARRGLSPERIAILTILSDAHRPLQPAEVARLLPSSRDSVKMLLSNMARDEQVVRVDGGYRISFGRFVAALAASPVGDGR